MLDVGGFRARPFGESVEEDSRILDKDGAALVACALDEGEGLLDFCLGDSSEPEIFWFIEIRSLSIDYETLDTVTERLENLSSFDDFILISRCEKDSHLLISEVCFVIQGGQG